MTDTDIQQMAWFTGLVFGVSAGGPESPQFIRMIAENHGQIDRFAQNLAEYREYYLQSNNREIINNAIDERTSSIRRRLNLIYIVMLQELADSKTSDDVTRFFKVMCVYVPLFSEAIQLYMATAGYHADLHAASAIH